MLVLMILENEGIESFIVPRKYYELAMLFWLNNHVEWYRGSEISYCSENWIET